MRSAAAYWSSLAALRLVDSCKPVTGYHLFVTQDVGDEKEWIWSCPGRPLVTTRVRRIAEEPSSAPGDSTSWRTVIVSNETVRVRRTPGSSTWTDLVDGVQVDIGLEGDAEVPAMRLRLRR